jgi:hypothetical protein
LRSSTLNRADHLNTIVPPMTDESEDAVDRAVYRLGLAPAKELALTGRSLSGLASTQLIGSLLDGLPRNTPEALRFIEQATTEGVGAGGRRP